MTLDEARKYLLVDTSYLTRECTIYADIYDKIGKNYFEAVSIRDAKKQLMEEVWSSLFTNLKEELNKSDKATEALVEIHKDYKNSVKNYLEAKLEADYWFSVKESFDKKAHFVKELGEFFIAGILNKMEVKAPTSVIAEADYEERRKKIRSKK